MSTVAPGSDSDIDLNYGQYFRVLSGDAIAGEALKAGRLVRISDGSGSETAGEIYHCQADDGSGTPAADHRGRVIGVVPKNYNAGEPVTVFGPGTRVYYGGGNLSAGQRYYLGADGKLDDAATQNDQAGVAVAINSDEYLLMRALPVTA